MVTVRIQLKGLGRIFLITENMSSTTDIGSMRALYKNRENTFTEDNLVSKEPFDQFKSWFEEARATPEILEPNAMCLATCAKNGQPSARFVLLKGFGSEGFKFFTNSCSRKGLEINENPKVALVFYWEPLRRSVRIEGVIEKLPDEEATAYFHSRPKDSQIGSALSNQSQPVASRQILQNRELEFQKKYADQDFIPKPKEWSGFIVKPHSIEFWQGQSDRIHDRIRFRIQNKNDVVDNVMLHQGINGWVYERLQP
ncbi:Pyridoxine-5'-phosphate oxidase, putative [Pediculus humanus corporis]|uniref:pyridoxal 5'-phosphate synthase n=1 Tax=Pediculus humanus subsp. corporis TaxID=121224 RepID=E0VFZ8_PEDHC|nr:Pyridoxine-5'-phosphate oxidase, putative [Pediculus humanus corporis]EEB12304.1 Pyridoxine-5'-phosphate oxidase, putative [Pediculus humanus corporis]